VPFTLEGPDGQIATLHPADDGWRLTPFDRPGPARAQAGLAFDPSGRFALRADAEAHAVHVFRHDAGALAPHRTVPRPGDGPRQVVFHPTLPLLYIANAASGGIAACHWNAAEGHFTGAQILRPVPRSYVGENRAVALAMSPDGRFLFAANRGHDSLATIAIQPDRGKMFLRRLDQITPGPDLLAMHPSGTAILAATAGAARLHGFRLEGRYAMLTQVDLPPAPFPIRTMTA
jgi:6-phosphogluconolactonase